MTDILGNPRLCGLSVTGMGRLDRCRRATCPGVGLFWLTHAVIKASHVAMLSINRPFSSVKERRVLLIVRAKPMLLRLRRSCPACLLVLVLVLQRSIYMYEYEYQVSFLLSVISIAPVRFGSV